jgi:hypothetical protein
MDRFSKNFENNTDKVWVEMELENTVGRIVESTPDGPELTVAIADAVAHVSERHGMSIEETAALLDDMFLYVDPNEFPPLYS